MRPATLSHGHELISVPCIMVYESLHGCLDAASELLRIPSRPARGLPYCKKTPKEAAMAACCTSHPGCT